MNRIWIQTRISWTNNKKADRFWWKNLLKPNTSAYMEFRWGLLLKIRLLVCTTPMEKVQRKQSNQKKKPNKRSHTDKHAHTEWNRKKSRIETGILTWTHQRHLAQNNLLTSIIRKCGMSHGFTPNTQWHVYFSVMFRFFFGGCCCFSFGPIAFHQVHAKQMFAQFSSHITSSGWCLIIIFATPVLRFFSPPTSDSCVAYKKTAFNPSSTIKT